MPGLERLARELEDVAFLYVDVGIVKYLRSFITVLHSDGILALNKLIHH